MARLSCPFPDNNRLSKNKAGGRAPAASASHHSRSCAWHTERRFVGCVGETTDTQAIVCAKRGVRRFSLFGAENAMIPDDSQRDLSLSVAIKHRLRSR
jgi:hypothetical protein